jgi:restriction endonuclease Mrr
VGVDELAGRDLAEVVAQLLANADRSQGPVPAHKLAETLQRRGRGSAEPTQTQGALVAAARVDNLRREAEGQRPRFRVAGNRIGLTEWQLDGELLRLERDIAGLVDRYREAARRQLNKRIQELPHRAIGELVVLLLERAGLTSLVPVRRPGAVPTELHLTGTLPLAGANGALHGGGGELRVAVVVRRDGREVGRERVTELRGALHHYGPADAGWIVTTGQVLSGAREEAAAAGAAPITLIDGQRLARLCEELGVGMVKTELTLPAPDVELFEALRSGGN